MTAEIKIRPTILLPLREHRTYLDHYFNQGGMGGVFVPGYLKLGAGTEVDVEIAFAKEQVTIHARGIVRWKRMSGARNLPAGVGVEFHEAERRTRDLLLDFAEGRTVKLAKRRSRRYPVMVDIEYRSDAVFIADVTDDLSRDGAFVRTDKPLDVGTVVALRLKPPGGDTAIEVKGEVRWNRTEGQCGFGVRFIFDRPNAEKQVRDLVERVRAQLAQELEIGPAA
ncbi:MAG: TIGR02266 family protein [Deltaproteobacteria bacterium]|nr:TIGR02266 family protein [Deltaproteobacteria bacterium]